MPDQPGDEGRRAAQIRAVREVLERLAAEPESIHDQLAAEVVAAVLNAGGLCGDTTRAVYERGAPLVCTMPAGHAGRWHGDDNGTRWARNEPTPDALDQAHAAGYRDAITALRDLTRYKRWVTSQGFDDYHRWYGEARRTLADYLEAVGPGQGQSAATDEDWRQAAEHAEEALSDEWSDQKLTEEESEHRVLLDILEIAPDGTTHTYWSTHCRHGRHEDCSATEMTGRMPAWPEAHTAVLRKPAQCKTCAARCICDCHKPVSDG